VLLVILHLQHLMGDLSWLSSGKVLFGRWQTNAFCGSHLMPSYQASPRFAVCWPATAHWAIVEFFWKMPLIC
jgi:hypothetical protein